MRPAPEPKAFRRRRRQRGAVLVEMALVLPLLAALLVVVVDLGLALREYQVLQNAAREAARYAINPQSGPATPTYSEAAVKAVVVDYMLQHAGIDAVSATSVSVVHDAPIVDGPFTLYGSQITVTYSRQLLIAAGGLLPLPAVTLKASAVFRNMYE